MAGGSFAETAGRRVAHAAVRGKITGATRGSSETGRGFFLADAPLADAPSLVGRVLLVRHGDGATRGWTLDKVENTPDGARLFVREEPGFLIEPRTGEAQYYQFPRNALPPPHRFGVPRISRTR